MAGLSSPSQLIPVERVETSVYTVPTDLPESDGTYTWDSTTMVLVQVTGGGITGLGYTYADPATAKLIESKLGDVVSGMDALSVQAAWEQMVEAIRNLGRPGISSMAISAVDIALWDLKAKLLGLPLARLLGQMRDGVPVYGSGGFTSYTLEQLADQLGNWVDAGIPRVKMKVGRDPNFDVIRVRTARERIGPETELFIDANGAYDPRTALFQAERLSEYDVSWFEEPVSSDNLPGLHFMREHAPARMDIAAGEYGYDLGYFRRMLAAEAVDVQQADATRCAGITGFLRAATLCQAHMIPLSAHCGPTAHLAVCCAAPMLRHLEFFHDHARIERIFFDGFIEPVGGVLYPDLARPGLGVELKQSDAEKYRVG